MQRTRTDRNIRRKSVSSRARRLRPTRLWPNARLRRRCQKLYRRSSAVGKSLACLAALTVLALTVNWIYQVICKPSELLFPVSGALYKTPSETWRQYAPIFRRYATKVMTPDLLAAIAQVESSGNPIGRTYWRWSWTTQPFEIYRPASSGVGMYQMTDGTFAEARRYCIRNHAVIQDGPWNSWRSCWFNALYARVVPGDAAELTSAYLDYNVAATLARHRVLAASLAQQQKLAALIHLCGAAAGEVYVARRFRLSRGQRCGDQDPHRYLAEVGAMQAIFQRLAGGSAIAARRERARDQALGRSAARSDRPPGMKLASQSTAA